MSNPYLKQNIRKQFRFDIATIGILEAICEKKGYNQSDAIREAIAVLGGQVLTQDEFNAAMLNKIDSVKEELKSFEKETE